MGRLGTSEFVLVLGIDLGVARYKACIFSRVVRQAYFDSSV